ncbi:LruC domain-containing protein [Flammeovirga kamogawensis]|uniref:LruC domain-containing protein n=1 Tax=Flammeovirga kamogawensis TaxID=373891 RepID=A0ABX8H2I1_9BACT|nr:LruC domain-containing protein [Flammeovirga kamogawensis]MBB6460223.1 LruC domain-containing protein [Flammeovirga kamogawensis]QWG10035.1 LruC domain-containing protein [Flammeovirga kamogawensis]TRX65542.1 LruC domain-containing protein [Flammeovirga kamogawensis]
MKKFILKLIKLHLLVLSALLCRCTYVIDENTLNENLDPINNSVEDIKVPKGFNFETTDQIKLKIKSEDSSAPSIFSVYITDDNEEKFFIGKGVSDDDGLLDYYFNYPKYISKLYIERELNGEISTKEIHFTSNYAYVTFTESRSSDRKVNQNTIISDADKDGIDDTIDEFKQNPKKAFNNYFPSSKHFSSIAFEDLYPLKGDYDFNDLIVNYQFNLITNASNLVTFIEAKIVFKYLKGTEKTSGFGIELPFHSDSIKSASGSFLTTGKIQLNNKGLESDNDLDKPVIIVFDNSYGMGNENGDLMESDTIYININISDHPIAFSDLNRDIPYNSFIFINKDRGHEVHLPGKKPTQKFNKQLLSLGDDVGDFKTQNGHPWAIHIPYQFTPPQEGIDITNAYSVFDEFVSSEGNNDKDWFIDIDNHKVYSNLIMNE